MLPLVLNPAALVLPVAVQVKDVLSDGVVELNRIVRSVPLHVVLKSGFIDAFGFTITVIGVAVPGQPLKLGVTL